MRHFIAAAMALALVACGTGSPSPHSTPGPIESVTDTITIKGTQGLILAELAYNTAAHTALSGVQAGLIKGDAAVQVRALNLKALNALAAAKVAQSASDQAAHVAEAMDAITGLRALAPAN